MKLTTEDEIERESKIIKERGEKAYDKIQEYMKSGDDLVSKTPLMGYAHAGLRMVQDTYMTMMDITPYSDHRFDLDSLRHNCDILLRSLESYSKERKTQK